MLLPAFAYYLFEKSIITACTAASETTASETSKATTVASAEATPVTRGAATARIRIVGEEYRRNAAVAETPAAAAATVAEDEDNNNDKYDYKDQYRGKTVAFAGVLFRIGLVFARCIFKYHIHPVVQALVKLPGLELRRDYLRNNALGNRVGYCAFEAVTGSDKYFPLLRCPK